MSSSSSEFFLEWSGRLESTMREAKDAIFGLLQMIINLFRS